MCHLLIQRGKFSLDDNPLILLGADMKGVHKWWEKLKVRHVLNYTCGFGFILEALIPIEGVDVTKWDKMFQSVPKFWNLAAEPGTVHCYTTSGPGVIVRVFLLLLLTTSFVFLLVLIHPIFFILAALFIEFTGGKIFR